MNMKLLLVDDNPQMRQMLRQMLTDLAEAIVECGDGAEAVAAYTAERFSRADRVVMDLQMPRVGGIEATCRIRAAHPDAQIIIVTQFNDPHWRAAAAQAGAVAYITKDNLLALRAWLRPGLEQA